MKLVRDRIPEIAPHRQFRKASGEELKSLILSKVLEEAQEVSEATSTANLIEELADLHTVMLKLCEEYKIDWLEVLDKVESKNEGKGSFSQGWVLIK